MAEVMKTRQLITCLATAMALPLAAHSAVIIGNLPTTPLGSTNRVTIDANGHFVGFQMGSSDYKLESIVLTLLSEEPEIDESCNVSIYASFNDEPAGILGDFGTVIAIHNVPFDDYQITVPANFILKANTTYWLGLKDDESSPVGPPYWMASTPEVTPTGAGATFFGTFGSIETTTSFQLNGTAVPEPSAAMLGALGLLCTLTRRRR